MPKILLVEDEAITALTETKMLEKHGYEVVSVYNGEKAVETVEQDPEISLILMDIDLGKGIDGTEAAQRILEKHDLPIVFLSSHTETEVVEKTEGITSYGYIVKNSGETVIIASIKMAFRLFDAKMKERLHEELLRKSEHKFRNIFDNITDAVFIHDLDGHFLEVNNVACRRLGYTREELLSMHPTDIDADPYSELVADRINQIKENEKMIFESEHKRKDGTTYPVEISSRKTEHEGEPCIISVTRDISERKNSEEEIQLSLQRYHQLFENISDCAAVYKPVENGENFVFVDFNKSAEKAEKTNKNDVIGRKVTDVFPAIKEFGLFETLKKVHNNGNPEHLPESQYKDENIVGWRDNYVYSLPSGEIVAVYKDLAEQKRLEQKLKNNEKNLRITLNSIGDAVISTDIDGKITRMNLMAEELTGWSLDAAKGKNLSDIFRIIKTDTREIADNPVDKVLQKGEIVGLTNHTTLISKDGHEYQISDSAAPIKDDEGSLNGVVLVFRDVTDQYEKDRKLKEHMRQIECFYKITEIAGKSGISIGDTLQETAEIIPSSLKYPEICECKISLYREVFQTKNFISTKGTQSRNIIVNGVVSGELIISYIDGSPFLKEEIRLLDAIAERLGHVIEKKETEEMLKSIEWMLSGKSTKQENSVPEYGDVSELNKDGLILKSVGKEQLRDIASEYLDLLDTSSAIYEKNGDYALGIFSSGWCQSMDSASRRLCNTEDNQKALESGKWLCHESCWRASSLSMEEGKPVDIECNGGIKMYAVPIWANGEIVGAMNFGYGNPPKDEAELKRLSERYNIPKNELKRNAEEYKTRPQFIIDYAKERIQIAAKNLGYIIEHTHDKDKLLQEERYLRTILQTTVDGFWLIDIRGNILDVNDAYCQMSGYSKKELLNMSIKDIDAVENEEDTKSRINRIIQNGFEIFKTKHRRKDGSIFDVEISTTFLDIGKNHLVCFARDITEHIEYEQAIQKALKNKDFLMKELNHRVKNNLSMVNSLIYLKELEIDDDLTDLKHRIEVIKLVHEKLYQYDDIDQIEVKEYFQELLEAIFVSSTYDKVEIVNNIENFRITTKTAIPLGLVVNEIATNAIKYGFSTDIEPSFIIEMTKDSENNQYVLILSNTGNPFPEKIGLKNPETLGLQLISNLVEQIKGTVELRKKPNPLFTIRFPKENCRE